MEASQELPECPVCLQPYDGACTIPSEQSDAPPVRFSSSTRRNVRRLSQKTSTSLDSSPPLKIPENPTTNRKMSPVSLSSPDLGPTSFTPTGKTTSSVMTPLRETNEKQKLGSVLDKNLGSFDKDGVFNFAMIGMVICDAVVSLHREGLIAGC
ncbi:hypothetical protein F3Y22_tig00111208pilonHSYRG00276 [Hibiscus syriacus]|uniref:Uncharacterized protein n=1 Tax=Hibiscus syriacus TaxID=106335 RepID=A0A6A2YVX9_HIBSY|nr:hypothetical protein F3Y22_tig00111208pilonHSYRG00276 [Hibiscus syriacus]